jgi:hypothetical protein
VCCPRARSCFELLPPNCLTNAHTSSAPRPFPSDKVAQGYAYILTHCGMPCIFYDHFLDWGSTLRKEITTLLEVCMCGLQVLWGRQQPGVSACLALRLTPPLPHALPHV